LTLAASQDSISFSTKAMSPGTPSASFQANTSDGSPIEARLTQGQGLFAVTTRGNTISIAYNRPKSKGVYRAEILVSAKNDPKVTLRVPVTLTIQATVLE
jgi:hypothetical protein